MGNEKITLLYKELSRLGLISAPSNLGKIWELLSSEYPNITVEFDREYIHTNGAYKRLFRAYASCFSSEHDIRLKDVDSFFDSDSERAGVKVRILDKEISREWKQASDWVTQEFFDFIKIDIEPLLKGRFVDFVDQDQFYRAIYVDSKMAGSVEELFRSYEQAPLND
jgi:hypothetical protein